MTNFRYNNTTINVWQCVKLLEICSANNGQTCSVYTVPAQHCLSVVNMKVIQFLFSLLFLRYATIVINADQYRSRRKEIKRKSSFFYKKKSDNEQSVSKSKKKPKKKVTFFAHAAPQISTFIIIFPCIFCLQNSVQL